MCAIRPGVILIQGGEVTQKVQPMGIYTRFRPVLDTCFVSVCCVINQKMVAQKRLNALKNKGLSRFDNLF